MTPSVLVAIDNLVGHAMKTAMLDMWPHIKTIMDEVLIPAVEAQKAAQTQAFKEKEVEQEVLKEETPVVEESENKVVELDTKVMAE